MHARRHSLSRYLEGSADPLTHFKIARGAAQPGFERLPCLLARAWADGRFEMVNPAWNRLGYSSEELAGHGVGELISLEPQAACAALWRLLAEGRSLEFGLLCKDGSEVNFHWNRQFDDFSTSMFIIADELPAA
jgi:PAS domain-containing protein